MNLMKVAIAGYAVEGKINYSYWREKGHEVTILDEREIGAHDLPYSAKAYTGSDAFDDLSEFDLVVRTASLNPKKLKKAKKVWSGTNEFFAHCPADIIGVTGTKGKGTTCSLIASILTEAGKTVHVVGNIGKPALEVLKDIKADDIVVYELSSFQLWDIEKSPHIAVVLMIEPDHLDVHASLEEYIAAKGNIRQYQTDNDLCLYHPTNTFSKQIACQISGNAYRYAVPDDGQVYVKSNTFCIHDEPICLTSALQIPGSHNLENACAAISAAYNYTENNEAIQKGLEKFTGLSHRLKFIKEVNRVKYYDDSIATTPGSATAALRSFEEPKVIILGGSKKGSDYNDLVKVCAETNSKVVAMGQTAADISKLCIRMHVICERVKGDMAAVVNVARALGEPGSVVILSPASASFDMFKDYADRGDQFIAAVNQL